jgi:Lon-like LonC helical domain
VHLALGMKHGGYNLFALGPAGIGKYAFVHKAVEKASATWPVPSDWCYVNNFAEPHRPRALRLPAGRGRPLRGDIEGLIEELKLALPAAFESENIATARRSFRSISRSGKSKASMRCRPAPRSGTS